MLNIVEHDAYTNANYTAPYRVATVETSVEVLFGLPVPLPRLL